MVNHFEAIRCIEKRIQQLNVEKAIVNDRIDNAEMDADIYFGNKDLENFNNEITSLLNTINFLIKNQ
jgi:hypothetical protein